MVIRNILVGWSKKLGLLPVAEAERALSDLRLRICGSCPLSKTSAILTLIGPDEMDFVDRLYCTKCSCPCEAKSLVVSEKCPVKNW